MNKFSLKVLFLAICISAPLNAQWHTTHITKAEKTNYQETSTYADVMKVIHAIMERNDLVHLEHMGTSKEGKQIPLVIMANPKIKTPRQAVDSGKPVIYVQGNIHAGEVEGKEVLQILMREILLGDKKYLLDNQIILFAPIYNTDSNDQMEEGLRPSQEDSPLKTGVRPNSQGWDLNRDGIKMEAIETQALMQNVILKWDPALFVDLHTTNGTWHGYSLTWAPSYHSAGEKAPYDFTWDQLLPEVSKKVETKYDIHLGPYGWYRVDKEGWPIQSIFTYNHHPRYLVNQFGLRNRMAILSESFAHERFYQRINATRAFVSEILEFSNENGQKIITINRQAEENAIRLVQEHAGKIKKGVRFKMVPLEKPIQKYRTYDYTAFTNEKGKTEYVRSPNIIELSNVTNNSRFEPTVESTLPKGYLIPASMKFIADHLRKHGVIVKELEKSRKATGEIFMVKNMNKNTRAFEKHQMVTVEGTFQFSDKKFKKGDFWVDLAQPLANLIFYMLEPQSDDGLVTWNFFDEYFESNGLPGKKVAYPVFKYYELK